MRVAVVIADSNSACPVPAVKGGAVASLVDHLVKENSLSGKCDFTVFTYYDPKAEELSKKYKKVKFVWIKIPRLINALDACVFGLITRVLKKTKAISFKHVFSLLYYILLVSIELKNNDYDKVVLENNIMISWVLRLNRNSKKYAGKYYYHLHNIPRINGRNKKIFAGVKKYLCVSEYLSKCIQCETNPIGPVPKESIRVVKNCIDTDLFNNENLTLAELKEIRLEYGIEENENVIVFAGRISKEKGIDYVIESLEYLIDLRIKLIIVGNTLATGNINDVFSIKIQQLAKKYKNNIIFTGFVSQEKISRIYQMADFAVLPSIWEEPAGLTMIEAMACETLVITTRSGGIPEYTNNYSSIILDRDDQLSIKIAETIRYYIKNEKKAKKIAEEGRRYVQENFSMKNYLNNFLDVLEDDRNENS